MSILACRGPIFGIDIDNVLSATDVMIRKLIQKLYNIKSTQEEIRCWHYSEALGISPSQEQIVFKLFHFRYCRELEVISGAREALYRFGNIGQVWLITQRPKVARANTLAWLKKNHIRYDRLIFSKNKAAYAPYLSVLVEDNAETAYSVVTAGTQEVFLIDYPWNRMTLFHPHIWRVKCWGEILGEIFDLPRINSFFAHKSLA